MSVIPDPAITDWVPLAAGGDIAAAVVLSPSTSLRNVIQPSADVIPVIVKAIAGQTADLFDIQDSAGTPYVQVNASGRMVINAPPVAANLVPKYTASPITVIAKAAPLLANNNTSMYGAYIMNFGPTDAFQQPVSMGALYTTSIFRGTKASQAGSQANTPIGIYNQVQDYDPDNASLHATGDVTNFVGLLFNAYRGGPGSTSLLAGGSAAVAAQRFSGTLSIGPIGKMYGYQTIINVTSAATSVGELAHYAVASHTPSGPITTAAAFRAGVNLGGPNVGTSYGLYIAPQSGSTVASYAILSDGGMTLLKAGFSGVVPLTIRSAVGQSAPLQEWQESNGWTRLSVRAVESELRFAGEFGDGIISVSVPGNPFPNTSQDLILRPQFYGAVRVQYGIDASYQMHLSGGNIWWDKNAPSLTVIDMPGTGGNGQNYVRIGNAEWYISGAAHVFRGRGDTTSNVVLNGSNPFAGAIVPYALGLGERGVSTISTGPFGSYGLSFSANYWNGSASIVSSAVLYLTPHGVSSFGENNPGTPTLRLNLFDIANSGNESEGSLAYLFQGQGQMWFARVDSPVPFDPGISVKTDVSNTPGTTPFRFNSRPYAATGGVEFWSGGVSPTLQARILGGVVYGIAGGQGAELACRTGNNISFEWDGTLNRIKIFIDGTLRGTIQL